LQSGTQLVTAGVSADGTGLTINAGAGWTVTSIDDNSGAAEDLGIAGAAGTSTVTGSRLLAGINSTLTRNILGGDGLEVGPISFSLRDGTSLFTSLNPQGSISDLINELNALDPNKLRASIDSTGTGLSITDLTVGTDNLFITGGQAEALGLATGPAGVASSTVDSARLQHRYVSSGAALSSFNSGRGVGTGTFEITDSNGNRTVVDVGSDARTIGDVIAEINSRPGVNVRARINDNGDGLLLEERDPNTGGSIKMSIRDVSGAVAAGLNIARTASDNADNNFIDGSFERTLTFAADATLDTVVTAVNDAHAGVSVSVINDGAVGSPFRLNFTSASSGRTGRFTIAATGADLGLRTMAEGTDARVFFGSGDPAQAILLNSSTNDLDTLIPGVNIDLHAASATPVTVSVSKDTSAIETTVNGFITAYNSLIDRLDALGSYNSDTQQRGALLGDSAASILASDLFSTATRSPTAVSGPFQFLSQVGVKFDNGGHLELDSTKFQAALQTDPQAVADLFAAKTTVPRQREEIRPGVFVDPSGPDTYSSLGVMEKFSLVVDRYVNSIDGVLTKRRSTITDQITAQNDRIAQVDERLARREDYLSRQFQAMESALAKLQTQQSALSGLNG